MNSVPVRWRRGRANAQAARIEWPNHGLIDVADRAPLDYFLLTFSHAQRDKIVSHTNRQLLTFRLPAGLTAMELQRYLGIRLVMTLEHGHGTIESYWDTEGDDWLYSPQRFWSLNGGGIDQVQNIARSLCFHDTMLVTVIFALNNINTLVFILLIFFCRMIHGLTFETLWVILTVMWRSFESPGRTLFLTKSCRCGWEMMGSML